MPSNPGTPEREYASSRRGSRVTPYRLLLLLSSAALMAAIMVIRFSVQGASEGVTVLLVLPVSLLAVEFGAVGGLIAAAASMLLTGAWAITAQVPIGLIGFVSRGAAFALAGGLVGYLASHRREVQEENRRHFELSLDLICTASTDGTFRRVNPAFERTLGFTPGEVEGRSFLEFVHDDDREPTLAEVAELVSGGHETRGFQGRFRAKDGSHRWLEWTARFVEAQGLIYAVARDISERKRLELELSHMAQHDPLTGLFNRRRFQEELASVLSHAQRHGRDTAVLMIDLDGFKAVNDEHGHRAGDELLCEVADSLRASLRTSDVAARLGGDEFAVVVPEADAARAEVVARKVLAGVAGCPGSSGSVRASVGVAIGRDQVPETLMALADQAMYAAKASGGDAFTIREAPPMTRRRGGAASA